ncbi:MAG: hypothetical protein JKY65_17470 [Planctomycetes bacterium]|nr:hypothetical protein [Planctomycetota bacterium]
MVLRFNCPGCQAPYSVADQFAGRTLQCTQCGTAIQIGAPIPQAPMQQPPAGLMGSMEWSGDNLQQPNFQQQQQQQQQQGGGGLSLMPEADPGFRDDDDDEEEEEEAPPPKKRSRSSSQGRTSSRGKTSGREKKTSGRSKQQTSGRSKQKTSGRQRKGGSGGGRAPKKRGKSTGGGVATRDCPVCGEEVAAIAEACMHCNARLRGPSAASQLPKQLIQLAGPLLALALLGGGGYFLYSTFVDTKETKTVKVKTRKTRKTSGSAKTKTKTKTKTGKTAGKTGKTGKTEPVPSPSKTRKTGGRKTVRKTERPIRTPKPRETPRRDPVRDDPEVTSVAGNVIPKGAHQALFQTLLDAPGGKEGRSAVFALAKLDATIARPLIDSAMLSDDKRYRMRLHRAALRLGDAATQKGTIEASLKSHKNVKLFWTVLTAIELDSATYRARLLSLGYDANTAAGRALADASLDGGRVSSNLLNTLREIYQSGDREIEETIAPLVVLAGGVEALTATANALEHPSEPIRKLAQRALVEASAGQGPGESASSAAWKEWVDAYQPIRNLLAKASANIGQMPDVKGAVKRNEAVKELVAKGALALKALPVFLREEASRNELACQVVAALIVRLASRSDREVLVGILTALESHDEAATQVIAAVMVVADADLAAEAARAVIKAGIPARRQEEFPALKRQPRADAVQGIVDWAGGRSDKVRHDAHMLAAAFRPPQLAKLLVEGRQVKNVKVVEVAARLGSAKIESALLAVLSGDRKTAFGIGTPQDAARRLRDVGTASNSLSKLTKIVASRSVENGDIPVALSAIAPPSAYRKLKKSLDGWKNSSMGLGMYRAYGEIGGEKAVAELGKRFKKLEDGSSKRGLIRVLLDLGSDAVREEALKPFLKLKAANWREGMALSANQFTRLFRCGKPEDAELLVEYIKEGRPKSNAGRCLVGIGVMGYKPGLGQVTAHIFQNGPNAARAAVAAALLGGGRDDMLGMITDKAVTDRVKGDDMEVLAALSLLDADAAGKAAQPFLKTVAGGNIRDHRAVAGLAFALASANDPGLTLLVDVNDRLARAAVARGIAWAAIANSNGIEYPPALDLLRNDPEAIVRVEAAIARAYLDRRDAVQDLARNLPFLTEAELSVDRMAGSSLVELCDGEGIRTLRGNVWHANGFAGGKAPPFRKSLGKGRIWEVEREMR